MARTTRAATGSTLRANNGVGEPAANEQAAGQSRNNVVGSLVDVPMTRGTVVVEKTRMEANDDYVDAQQGEHVSPESFTTDIDLDLDVQDPQCSISNRGDGSRLDLMSIGDGQGPLLDDSEESEEDYLRKLRKKQRRALRQAEIRMLEAAKKKGFREGSVEPGAKRQRLDKDKLALERAKDTKRPGLYTGQSQKHLDKFLRQAEATFRTKPTIYATDEDKCSYAGESLDERPGNDWAAMDKAIGEPAVRKRKRSSKNRENAEKALAVVEVAREKNARLKADLQVALGKIAEMERQALIVPIPGPAAPVSTTSAPAVPIGEQTLKDLTTAVSDLARSSQRRSVPSGGLPGRAGAPSWCARCIIKGGWWKDVEHNCVTVEGRKNCTHCAAMKAPCQQIPKRLWGEACGLIREIRAARSLGEEALLVTAAKGAKLAKRMRVANSWNKPLAARPNGLVEQKLDQLIALGRINAQLAMHDHGLRMEMVDDVLLEDDAEEESDVKLSDEE